MLSAKAIATLPAAGVGGVYYGSFESIDGSYLAWKPAATGVVHIFKWVASAWVEMTDGTTRFSSLTPVSFAIVKESTLNATAPFNVPSERYLVVQNGDGDPLVMKASLTAAASLKKHQTVGLPGTSNGNDVTSRITYSAKYNIAAANTGLAASTITSITPSGGATTFYSNAVANSGKTNQYIPISIGSTAASGDTVKIIFATSVNWSLAKEMHILFGASVPEIFNGIKIEAGVASASYVTLYDSSSTNYAAPILIPSGDYYMVGLKLPTVASASYDTIRITYKNNIAPATAQYLNIYGIFASYGTISGGTQFSVSQFNSTSRAESPAVVATDLGEPTADLHGGSQITGLSIPISAALHYEYTLNTVYADASGSPDYRCVYAKLPEGSEFNYVKGDAISTNSILMTSAIQYLLPAPTGLHMPIQKGNVTASIGPRYWAGGVANPSAAGASIVWFSSLDSPFRFRQTLEFTNGVPDIKGASTINCQGEVVQAITPIAGGAVGSEGCYIFTDQNIYQAGGSDSFQLMRPGRKAGFGTNSPNSIAVYAGLIVFMDSERQVRFLDASMTPISRDRVEDKLLAIPAAYIGNTAAGIWRDKYYLAYTPSGGTTNTELLVYDIRRGIWYSDTVATPIVRFNPFLVSGERQNLAYLSTGQQIQYDYPFTSDLGTNITITLKSRELNNGLWLPIVVKNIGAIVAKSANGTALTGMSLTCKRYTKVSGVTPTTATIDLDDVSLREYGTSDNLNWRWDVDSSGNTPATIPDPGASIELTGTVLSGTKIYSIVAEVEPVELGGADRL